MMFVSRIKKIKIKKKLYLFYSKVNNNVFYPKFVIVFFFFQNALKKSINKQTAATILFKTDKP